MEKDAAILGHPMPYPTWKKIVGELFEKKKSFQLYML